MNAPITVVLADDHHVVRQGIRAILELQEDIAVVGEASDGLEVSGLVRNLVPRVLVVDLVMPGLGGLDVIREVTLRYPGTRVVVLSMHSSEAYVSAALRNGASAYVLKDSSSAELVKAIREAAAGRRYLSPPLSQIAVEAYLRKAREAEEDEYESLTSREREVFSLAAEGLTSRQIGKRLFISPRTVETHLGNILKKLDLKNKTDLVRYAARRGRTPDGREPGVRENP